MKITLSFSVVLSILIFVGCKRSKINTPVNKDLKAAFNYQPGTYWIYKDSLTGDIDSFVVISNTPTNINIKENYYIDNIQIVISEQNITSTSKSTKYKWEYYYQSNMFDVKIINTIKINDNISFFPLLNYPFIDSFDVCGFCMGFLPGAKVKTISINNSYKVSGMNFSNVAIANHAGVITSVNSTDYDDWFYLCPIAGIIKMRINHPQDSVFRIWEILSWNIIK